MVKQQRRKPKRRPVLDDKVDEKAELDELAELLFEHRLDGNAANWLTLPWRSGWNAIGLALEVAKYESLSTYMKSEAWFTIVTWLEELIDGWPTSNHTYVEADEYIPQLGHMPFERAARTALRCLQMMIAKSDGGGHNYNHALHLIADQITEAQILQWRAQDALNYDHKTPITPAVERGRRAFAIAWRRGLFHAAYALPPVNAGVIKR